MRPTISAWVQSSHEKLNKYMFEYNTNETFLRPLYQKIYSIFIIVLTDGAIEFPATPLQRQSTMLKYSELFLSWKFVSVLRFALHQREDRGNQESGSDAIEWRHRREGTGRRWPVDVLAVERESKFGASFLECQRDSPVWDRHGSLYSLSHNLK